jgi:hypothetical protein
LQRAAAFRLEIFFDFPEKKPEWGAEGPLAIWVFLVIALAAIGFTAWGLRL